MEEYLTPSDTWEILVVLFFIPSIPQVFDSNVNKDKLLRLKLGSGKVIKVEHLAFYFYFLCTKVSNLEDLSAVLFAIHVNHNCFSCIVNWMGRTLS